MNLPMRLTLGMSCFFFACSVGEPMEGQGVNTPWSAFGEDDDEEEYEGTAGDGEFESSTSGPGDDDSTSGSDPGASTGDEQDDESTGNTFGDPDTDGSDMGDEGEQPQSGPWSTCPADGNCGAGLDCIVSSLIVASLCVESCLPAGDPSACSPSPGGTATPACLPVGSASYCVLDCSEDRTCPGGMTCHFEDDTWLCI